MAEAVADGFAVLAEWDRGHSPAWRAENNARLLMWVVRGLARWRRHMEPVRAFKTKDGALYETAAAAKRHEARCVVEKALRVDDWRSFDSIVDTILDNARTLGPVLIEMSREDVAPTVPAPMPAAPHMAAVAGK